MKKSRRIEITAFRRRVKIVSGSTNREDFAEEPPLPVEEGVWLNDADSGEAIEVESAEGQQILSDAVRSLERRLSKEERAVCLSGKDVAPHRSLSNGLYLKLRSFYRHIRPPSRCDTRKER